MHLPKDRQGEETYSEKTEDPLYAQKAGQE